MDFNLEMLAYCGLYCEQCSARVGFAEQDIRHIETIPAKYKRDQAKLSDYDCGGCKGRNLCGPCKIKDCAKTKAIDSCADCASFPCDVLESFGNDGVSHHRQALDNLHAIRRDGIESWFKNLHPPLRCHCGQRQSWYFPCPEHGQ